MDLCNCKAGPPISQKEQDMERCCGDGSPGTKVVFSCPLRSSKRGLKHNQLLAPNYMAWVWYPAVRIDTSLLLFRIFLPQCPGFSFPLATFFCVLSFSHLLDSSLFLFFSSYVFPSLSLHSHFFLMFILFLIPLFRFFYPRPLLLTSFFFLVCLF